MAAVEVACFAQGGFSGLFGVAGGLRLRGGVRGVVFVCLECCLQGGFLRVVVGDFCAEVGVCGAFALPVAIGGGAALAALVALQGVAGVGKRLPGGFGVGECALPLRALCLLGVPLLPLRQLSGAFVARGSI